MLKTWREFRQHDPIRWFDLESLSSRPVFNELLDEIVTVRPDLPDLGDGGELSLPVFTVPATQPWRWAVIGLVAVIAVGAVVVPLSVGTQNAKGRFVTHWHAARRLPSPYQTAGSHLQGRWELVSAVMSAGWEQDSSGPPPGDLTCVTRSACYALAGEYASPKGGAPLLSLSLYVSSDFGLTWSVLPMPSGFAPTSQLSCPDSSTCLVVGLLDGSEDLLTTTDGGHQWSGLPIGLTGRFVSLDCTDTKVCNGVVGMSTQTVGLQRAESFVHTSDGGKSWSSHTFDPTSSVTALACPSAQTCIVTVGLGAGDLSSGDVLYTTDGGQTWRSGHVPEGFGFSPFSSGISCGTPSDCLALGVITVVNSDQCGVVPPGSSTGCSSGATAAVSGVISTGDGGATWTLSPLPAEIPLPQMSGISCASATICWMAGEDATPNTIGNVQNGSSPIVLGTTDGGITWALTTFNIPADAPDYLGQSYITIGRITCPDTSACLALGVAAQSAPSTPVYRYVSGS